MQYSEKFRQQMVRRLVGPSAVSASALSREVGVPQPTLSKWLRASLEGVSKDESKTPSKALKARSPEEKAALVFEANGLSGEDPGAFLRRNGMHEADLEALRRWLAERLDPKKAKREAEAASKARKADQQRIKQLERELGRKDKALAEAAALLVLKEKSKLCGGPRTMTRTGATGIDDGPHKGGDRCGRTPLPTPHDHPHARRCRGRVESSDSASGGGLGE